MFDKRITIAAISGLTLIILIGVWFVISRKGDDHPHKGKASEKRIKQEGDIHAEKKDGSLRSDEVVAMAESQINDAQQRKFNLIKETYENILARQDPEATHKLINTLRKKLISETSNENAQAILQFLESGLDVVTGLSFRR